MDPNTKYVAAALKHYEAVRRAQKAYYDRNHPVETRRPRGRPRKVVPLAEVNIHDQSPLPASDTVSR